MTRGRRPMLDDSIQARIVQAIRLGSTAAHAAQYGGIGERTYYNWLQRGREEIERLDADADAEPDEAKAIYVQFWHAIKEAEGQAVVMSLGIIRDAALGDKDQRPQWQAAAWLLERRWPELYGRRVVDQRISVADLRQRALAAGLDADEVVAEADRLASLESGEPS